MKIAEVRELSSKEIAERVQTDATRLNQMELQHSISPMDNPTQIKELRRDIARLKTVLRERELNQQN
ncbi:MAG TPA: 50S ribosomal protein L29 [Bacteroidales bacterium]|nr:50S ribosomal protein L29 [Bacteroidales bacterium]